MKYQLSDTAAPKALAHISVHQPSPNGLVGLLIGEHRWDADVLRRKLSGVEE
jgi:hypothetical protein